MSDPEKKKRVLERNKQWRLDNPQKQRAAQAQCDLRRRMRKMFRVFKINPEINCIGLNTTMRWWSFIRKF